MTRRLRWVFRRRNHVPADNAPTLPAWSNIYVARVFGKLWASRGAASGGWIRNCIPGRFGAHCGKNVERDQP
jgi:hypothetical protein